jgi:hypothetical protein
MTASLWQPGTNSTQSTPASTPFSFVKGTVGLPGINFVGDTDTGIWSQANGYINFSVNGVNVLTIDPLGNVTTSQQFVNAPELIVASAATVDLGAVQSNAVQITGTNNISSFGTNFYGPKYIRFAGALTLQNSSSLICPGGANISISAGDTMIVTPKATAGISDGWAVVSYIKSVAATDLSNTLRVDVAAIANPVLLYTNIGSRNVNLTGAATITGFSVDAGGLYFITFSGANTLVNSASLVTNVGGNILTRAGDTCILRATAYGIVEILSYSSVAGISQAVSGFMYGNRIINGAQEIDQVNSGAAVTPAAVGYLTDMFGGFVSQASKLTFQQVPDAPAGLKNSMKITVALQYSPAATDSFILLTAIEGKDVIDFQLGTAGAATITVSNQIKGSVAGTYSIALRNAANNRSYVGTVSVTTSWAPIKITLVGDVTGTWATDNTSGLLISWDLGSGSNFNTTAGAWQAGNFFRTSGSVTFVNQVAGSTLNITGVDCRLGSVAPTVFERRANEFQLAQRYYWQIGGALNAWLVTGYQTNAGGIYYPITFPATMRAIPTVALTGTPNYTNGSGGGFAVASPYGGSMYWIVTALGSSTFSSSATSFFTFSARLF